MKFPEHPSNEAERLDLLRALDLLDTPPEEIFDCATRTLARSLRVPIALVSLVDGHRQWFKSSLGLALPETPRDVAFCAHTILGEGPFIIEDASQDERFLDNPLVTGDAHLRFYAGMPLESSNGLRIGTLCAIDTQPRAIGADEIETLRDLARLLSNEIQHRQAALLARNHVDSTKIALKESEALFRSVFELAAIGVAIVSPQGRFLRVNKALCDIVGYDTAELTELTFQHITHPDDLASDLELVEQLLEGRIEHYNLEKRYINRDREIVWIRLTVTLQRASADCDQYFISIIEDISERKRNSVQITALTANLEAQVTDRTRQLKALVEQAEQRNQQLRTLSETTALLTAANSMSEVAAIVKRYFQAVFPATNGALYLGGSGSYRAMAHWGGLAEAEEVIGWGDCWALRRGEEHRVEDLQSALFCSHRHCGHSQSQTCVPVFSLGEAVGLIELDWNHATSEMPPDSVLLAPLGRKLGLAITNIKLREELRLQALHDPLTGLYNRRYLNEFAERQRATYQRQAQGFAIIMIDLDHFKSLNDRSGHEFGDYALSEVAALLRRVVRSEDAAFRYGGEEFLLVTRCKGLLEATQQAERLRTEIEQIVLRPRRGPVAPIPRMTASIGLAVCPEHGETIDHLVSAADRALYAAKEAGRNRVQIAASGAARRRTSARQTIDPGKPGGKPTPGSRGAVGKSAGGTFRRGGN